MHNINNSIIGRLLALTLFLLAAPAWAAIYQVDKGCAFNGTGACNGGTGNPDCNCASSNGAAGPWNTLASMNGGTFSSDDIINIRGVHSTHPTCAGSDGRYGEITYSDGSLASLIFTLHNGTSGHPIIIQAQG